MMLLVLLALLASDFQQVTTVHHATTGATADSMSQSVPSVVESILRSA
jgi:hypothetical protein